MGIFPADRPKPESLLDAVYNTGTGLYRDAGRALGWFARQAAKPDAEVQSDFRNFASDMGTSLASIPKQAIGASTEATETGNYNPAPIVDAAMLPMGGPAAKAGEMVLGAGAKKATPLLGVLHGAGAPVEFGIPTHPPSYHDLGVHTAIEPGITHGYAIKHGSDLNAWPYVVQPGEKPKIDFISGERFDAPGATGPRTKPYLLDADGSLKYPVDAGKWNEPWSVIGPIEDEMKAGKPYPRGLLEDLHNISGSDEMWQSQFGPMMQDRGINHLFYPHAGSYKPDSFLTFDPNKLTPRYSPEGMKLAEERGVVEPRNHASRLPYPGADEWEGKPWIAPRGIMYQPKEGIETLTKSTSPKKNTFQWWGDDAPPSKLKEIDAQEMAFKAKVEADKKAFVTNVAEGKDLYKQYTSGKITEDQYHEAHKKFVNQPGWTSNPNMIHQANNNKIYDSYMEGAITKSELFKQYQQYNKMDGPPLGASFSGGGKGNVWIKNPDHPDYKTVKGSVVDPYDAEFKALSDDYFDHGKMSKEEFQSAKEALLIKHGKTSAYYPEGHPLAGKTSTSSATNSAFILYPDGTYAPTQEGFKAFKKHLNDLTGQVKPLSKETVDTYWNGDTSSDLVKAAYAKANPNSPKGTWAAAPPPGGLANVEPWKPGMPWDPADPSIPPPKGVLRPDVAPKSNTSLAGLDAQLSGASSPPKGILSLDDYNTKLKTQGFLTHDETITYQKLKSDKAIADIDAALSAMDEVLAKKGLDKTQKAFKGILTPESSPSLTPQGLIPAAGTTKSMAGVKDIPHGIVTESPEAISAHKEKLAKVIGNLKKMGKLTDTEYYGIGKTLWNNKDTPVTQEILTKIENASKSGKYSPYKNK